MATPPLLRVSSWCMVFLFFYLSHYSRLYNLMARNGYCIAANSISIASSSTERETPKSSLTMGSQENDDMWPHPPPSGIHSKTFVSPWHFPYRDVKFWGHLDASSYLFAQVWLEANATVNNACLIRWRQIWPCNVFCEEKRKRHRKRKCFLL